MAQKLCEPLDNGPHFKIVLHTHSLILRHANNLSQVCEFNQFPSVTTTMIINSFSDTVNLKC